MPQSPDYAALAARFEPQIPSAWGAIFSRLLWNRERHCPATAQAEALLRFVDMAYAQSEASPSEVTAVYPPCSHLFRAFAQVKPSQVRVVVLGQDPYHGAGQADGLCFSVPSGFSPPPSLRNIFRERESDLGIPAEAASPCLLPWAQQGVLLLNTTLTVAHGKAGSHRKQGWEQFTDGILSALDEMHHPIVFLLWGADARKKKSLLQNPNHLILESEHPSPLSAWRGFFGSHPFSRTNDFLRSRGLSEIDWRT